MAKERTAHAYELELRKMFKSRTGADMELWLEPFLVWYGESQPLVPLFGR